MSSSSPLIFLFAFLDRASQISSSVGIAGLSLTLVAFAFYIGYKRTRIVSVPDSASVIRILLKGSIGLALAALTAHTSLALADSYDLLPRRTARIDVFPGTTHLGDNVFSRMGGRSLPRWDDPALQPNENLVFYDKTRRAFLTHYGLPTVVSAIKQTYGQALLEVNLDAWRNVSVYEGEDAMIPQYEGGTVRVDRGTVLVWNPGHGNFYGEIAPIARTASMNLNAQIRLQGIRPEGKTIEEAMFWIHGLRIPINPTTVPTCRP